MPCGWSKRDEVEYSLAMLVYTYLFQLVEQHLETCSIILRPERVLERQRERHGRHSSLYLISNSTTSLAGAVSSETSSDCVQDVLSQRSRGERKSDVYTKTCEHELKKDKGREEAVTLSWAVFSSQYAR